MARGFSDEINDRYYLIIDGVDGRTHYAEVGELADPGDFETGAIVAVEVKQPAPRQVDRTIAEVGDASGGLYSEEFHRRFHPNDSAEFVRSHVRRLETLRRANLVQRFSDGTWEIPESYLEKAKMFEERARIRQPARLTLLSGFGLGDIAEAEGATWLDRQLLSKSPEALREAGFGREAKNAIERRRQWLMAEGLARETAARTIYERHLLRTLRRREVRAAAAKLSRELGKPFAETSDGDKVGGLYRRPVRLASGKFAVIEKSKEFTLVPWRPVLERQCGRMVSGVMRGSSVSFDFNRKRGIGIG